MGWTVISMVAAAPGSQGADRRHERSVGEHGRGSKVRCRRDERDPGGKDVIECHASRRIGPLVRPRDRVDQVLAVCGPGLGSRRR